MPVIVIGADTSTGGRILGGFDQWNGEVRVFVSDADRGADLKEDGFKVALGDVTDESHVEAAATSCFTAVLIAEAATDDRERSFASDISAVLEGWARAVANSEVTRSIWVTDVNPPETRTREVATIAPSDPDLVRKVVELDDAQTIGTPET